jgi:D-3-phosphoglycerate dehydrogenase
MKVLVTADLHAETLAALEALGLVVEFKPMLSAQELPDWLPGAHILVTGRGRVTRRAIEAASKLQCIVRAGVGIDGIDTQAASERGIAVADCGEVDAQARAELALGLILSLDRGIGAGTTVEAAGLRGRTLGLHGWDKSAEHLGVVARALGMRVLVHAPQSLSPTVAIERGVHWCDAVDSLYGRSDIVSIHAGPADGLLANRDLIEKLRPHATLVDVSGRGHLDLKAIHERLLGGTLRVGLDGYDLSDYGDDVPFSIDVSPLLRATFQKASDTAQVQENIAHLLVSALQTFTESRHLPNTRNALNEKPSTLLTIRHHPAPEVISAIFEALKEKGVSVACVERHVFKDRKAAVLRIGLDSPLTREVRAELSALSGVLDVEA